MAEVLEFRIRLMRDGETWYVVQSADDRHEIGSSERLIALLEPFLNGLALLRIERDGKRIPQDEW